MRSLFTLVLLFTLNCYPALSQSDFRSGYIVNAPGDTLRGLVDYRESRLSNEVCSFKAHDDGNIQKFYPGDISAYGFDNDKAFEVKTIDLEASEKVFAELLVRGRISLYMYADRFFVAKHPNQLLELRNKEEETYIENKNAVNGSNEPVRVVRASNEHIVTLNTLMNDCISMFDRIAKVYLSQQSLVKLINDYNHCIAPGESRTFKENKKWLKAKVGVTGAMNTESITISSKALEFVYYNNALFKKRYYPSVGFALNITSPRVKERISLQLEALYSNYGFTGYSEHTANSGSLIYRNDYTLKLSSLNINTAFRYTFPAKSLQPFFNIGVSNRFLFDNTALRREEAESNKTVETNEYTDVFLQKQHTGIFGGAGLNFKLLNYLLYSELRYNRGFNIASPPNMNNIGRTLDGKSNMISLLTGFYF